MRVAVLSDVHGNLHALEAVLEAVEAEQPDAVWSLGDVVGYGPRPDECCRGVQARAGLSLVGNHDLGVLGVLDLADFAPDAAAAATWTREQLSDEASAYLSGLAPSAEAGGVNLFHGSARDPVWEYVLSEEAALSTFELTTRQLVLVGHSHVALALRFAGGALEGGLAPGGTELELGDARWLLNPGSVGQPRDGDSRAAFLLLDLGRGRASFRRVGYPVERTQIEIREAGLPEPLATRLEQGL